MPEYELTYFDLKGLGEPIRMMLSYMNVEFRDNRISRDEWGSMKSKIPFGKLPVLDIDGKRHFQSQAIMRLLASKAKLDGNNAEEAYEINMIAGTIQDLQAAVAPSWAIQDPKAKDEFLEKIRKETIPYYFKLWDERAKENGGYLANGKLSWVDLYFHGYMYTFQVIVKSDSINDYPNLKLGREKVLSTPGIKEWVAKSPKTIM